MCALGDIAALRSGTAIARGSCMSSDHLAVAVSDPITNTRPSVPDESADDAPPTKRLGAFDLAFAVAAMEFVTDEEEAHDEEKEDEPPMPAMEDMLTMLPPPRFFIAAKPALQPRK